MQRPRAVTVLAVLALIIAGSNLLTGAMLVTGNLTLEQVFGPLPNVGDMRAEFEHVMKFMVLMLSLGAFAIGAGLLALKNWARIAMRVFTFLGFLGAVVTMFRAFGDREAAMFLFCAILGGAYYWAFHYLGQPAARAAFAPPPPPASAPPPPVPPGPDVSQ